MYMDRLITPLATCLFYILYILYHLYALYIRLYFLGYFNF